MAHTPEELVALDKKYVWHHLTQHKGFEPAIYVKGEGMRVTDIAGKTYLDAVSGGVWTVNVGYGRKEIVDAVAKQMLEFNYFANGIGNIPTIEFSEKLISKMPGMSRVYISNS
ncbi:MAG: aminotransferase class III-fold pyridoxal phosphate-dependent enzyme, partial [Desulfovibrio sp.]